MNLRSSIREFYDDLIVAKLPAPEEPLTSTLVSWSALSQNPDAQRNHIIEVAKRLRSNYKVLHSYNLSGFSIDPMFANGKYYALCGDGPWTELRSSQPSQ